MKKIVTLVAILVLMTSVSFGQEFVSSQVSGAKAILFTWSGLADINATEYNGGIGAKMFLSDYMALRVQLELGMYNEDIPPLSTVGKEGSISINAIGIGAAIEYHLSKGRVSPYIGAGVEFATVSTEAKPSTLGATEQITQKNIEYVDTDDDGFPDTYITPAITAIRIAAIIGAEYYITNGLSLSAEYQIGFQSASVKDGEITTTTSTTTFKQGGVTEIGIATAGFLTLAVYL